MESITLGQMAAALACIAAIIAGAKTLKKSIKEWLSAALKEPFEKIEKAQDEIKATQEDIKKSLRSVDMENCKNYLVTFLAELSRGEVKDETELQRFWEEYEHYQKLGGNSYIRNKVEELKGKKYL